MSRDAIDGSTLLYGLAAVYALTGDKDRALAELTKLARLPCSYSPLYWPYDPAFSSLRGDPRFEALTRDPKNNAPLF